MSVRTETIARTRLITIDRPHRRNAVDRDTAQALSEVFSAFESDDAADIAILTGAGSTFCAGADLKAIAEGRANRVELDGDGPMGPTRMTLSKPVIAAIEGHAVAGGLELALWCDLRVASEDAVFGVYCRRFGVPLIDGGTVRLPRLIGQSRALDMILTGRSVEGWQAYDWGLANRIAPPGQALEEALALAGQLAAFPQTCLRNDLKSARGQWGLAEPEALLAEVKLGISTLASGETADGAGRFAAGEGRSGAFPAPPDHSS